MSVITGKHKSIIYSCILYKHAFYFCLYTGCSRTSGEQSSRRQENELKEKLSNFRSRERIEFEDSSMLELLSRSKKISGIISKFP